ncbi:hypothetical protein HanIR_Chr10g0471431 [Helianthus annuus]|nr:hypothetical protein HanIR_Chr10g0471431 [Helianthus annuus]
MNNRDEDGNWLREWMKTWRRCGAVDDKWRLYGYRRRRMFPVMLAVAVVGEDARSNNEDDDLKSTEKKTEVMYDIVVKSWNKVSNPNPKQKTRYLHSESEC